MLSFLTVVVIRGALNGSRAAAALPVLGQVGDFTLIERDGRTVAAHDLAGRVWVADFIFTRCGSSCPRMTARMAQLAADLAGRPEVCFVSFTVDPVHDSPAVLASYAESYTADPKRWLFLTGSKETIYRLARGSFRLGVEEVTALEASAAPPSGSAPLAEHAADEPFIHSTRFVLVDPQGRIRGYYDSTEETKVRKLRADVETLLREASPA
jgi:protein SCO1/2